ncbi:hypothetical protein HG530_004918 [Fusarium avenaceum]|nr:hypothetical protein HG530_004918 [Fusarium avenaceum]
MNGNKFAFAGWARLYTLFSDILVLDSRKELDIQAIVSRCEIIGSTHAVRQAIFHTGHSPDNSSSHIDRFGVQIVGHDGLLTGQAFLLAYSGRQANYVVNRHPGGSEERVLAEKNKTLQGFEVLWANDIFE